MDGWVRYKNQEIFDMSNKIRGFDDVLKDVIARRDFLFSPLQRKISI